MEKWKITILAPKIYFTIGIETWRVLLEVEGCTTFWNHSPYRYCRNRKTSLVYKYCQFSQILHILLSQKHNKHNFLPISKTINLEQYQMSFLHICKCLVICTDLGLWILAAYIFSFWYPIATFFSLSLFSDFSWWAALSAHGQFLKPSSTLTSSSPSSASFPLPHSSSLS